MRLCRALLVKNTHTINGGEKTMQQTSQRPMGVTILAVLAALGGLSALYLTFVLFGANSAIWGIIYLILALASLAFAYGAWTLQPWAWMLGIGLEAISIILAIVIGLATNTLGSQIIGIIISGVIIYYLMTPDVKKAFGQS
jgi:hypothetical protein